MRHSLLLSFVGLILLAACTTAAPAATPTAGETTAPTAAAQESPAATSPPAPAGEEPPAVVFGRTDDGVFFHGAADAPVTLIDYSDFL